MGNEKFEELDKQITKQIMKEFEGVVVEHECPTCHAKFVRGHVCDDCKNEGFIKIKY